MNGRDTATRETNLPFVRKHRIIGTKTSGMILSDAKKRNVSWAALFRRALPTRHSELCQRLRQSTGAFVEGIWERPQFRRKRIGGRLLETVRNF